MTTKFELAHADLFKELAPALHPSILINAKIFMQLLDNSTAKHGLYMTQGLNELISENKISNEFVQECITKHFNFDFGQTSFGDKVENFRSMVEKHRIMSFFDLSEINTSLQDTKIYIETCNNWEHTTLLLNKEY